MSILPAPAHRTTGGSPRGRLALLPVLFLVALLALSACSAQVADEPAGGGADSAASAAGDGAAEAVSDDASIDGEQGDRGSDVQALVPGTVAQDGDAPLMVRTVTMELLVDDVLAAVSRARATAVGVDGWVSSEEVRPGDGEGDGATTGWATLVLRVPSEDLDAVVASLGELGEVTSSRSSAEDVTTEYRDVQARVATLEASAQRLRELVDEAGSVEAIAGLERELAAREADLDALKARRKVLAEDVSRSTVTLHLAEDAATLADTAPATGFVAGLQQGWAAFAASVTMLLTALGAVLPFALAVALVAVPVLAWRRRSRTPAGSSPPQAVGSD